MGEKLGEGRGVSFSPAEISSFIWSVNSKWEEIAERVTREEAELGGVWGVKGSGSSQLVLVRG